MSKAEIVKVTIKIGDIEVSMGIEELKQLRDSLNELLGSKVTTIPYVPYIPIQPRPYWGGWYSSTDSTAKLIWRENEKVQQ